MSAVARATGRRPHVPYRHDLPAQVHATRAGPPPGGTGPAVTRASLQADLLAARERALRLSARIQQLQKRLSATPGEQAWRESGLGAPVSTGTLNQKIAHLEQQVSDLRLQLDEATANSPPPALVNSGGQPLANTANPRRRGN